MHLFLSLYEDQTDTCAPLFTSQVLKQPVKNKLGTEYVWWSILCDYFDITTIKLSELDNLSFCLLCAVAKLSQ